MEGTYELEVLKALAKIDKIAIERVKQLKDEVLYVRGIFQKYGITRDKCRPRIPLRDLISPQSPLEEEVIKFEQAEKKIHAAVNDSSSNIPLQSAIAANIEMMYFYHKASFETIDQTVTPKL